ncbi:hypothetical protein [Helicobacter sp. MIT 14-3879]|nr:hypothetical protein [Helicobacter sp. MIT 14-3879]
MKKIIFGFILLLSYSFALDYKVLGKLGVECKNGDISVCNTLNSH